MKLILPVAMPYFDAARRLWWLVATGLFAIVLKLVDGIGLFEACAFPISGLMLAVFFEAKLKR